MALYSTISLHQKYGLINKDGVVFEGSGLIRGGILYSPRNENLNSMARIKFLNLLLYSSKKKLKNLMVLTKLYWSWAGGTVVSVRTVVVPNISSNSVILCKIKMQYLAIFLLIFNLCLFSLSTINVTN